MSQRNWRVPSLQRELALWGGGIIAAALIAGGAFGAAGAFVWDKFVHRHRAV